MARLSLYLLGQFKATLDGAPVTDFSTDKARALLAYLAVEADRPHRREALAGLLWPDQPQRKANQNLRQALLYLRQALGDCEAAPFLLVTRETVQFHAGCDYGLDVAAFTTLSQTSQQHRHIRIGACLPCLRRLEQMAELYRGEFLAQFFLSDSSAFEEWAVLKREWLHRQAIEALARLADYYERRGDLARARQYAWRQVELEPWREEAHRQLMRLLALDGQRSTALAQYEKCRAALTEELGVEPTDETASLCEQIRSGQDLSLPAPACHLPPSPTPFVGREEELAELAELLADPDCRLVTLVGPGGIGKTRLALQAAADQVGAFAHGVHFASLASASSPELMVPAIADALEFPFASRQDPQEQLVNYWREKEMLLVLDNLEHLLTSTDERGAKLLNATLKRAPGVRLLVTSRERLNLQEEWVYEVAGLTYPTSPLPPLLAGEGKGERSKPYSAINLFLQRALQAQRHFVLPDTEAPFVARICQLVEGMPLGIELAASWVAVRSCADIAHEMERNLDILATSLRNVPERQRSVWATFEYSWQMLSLTEQELFARLSVFRGGFDLNAAVAVAGATLSTLAALLGKSLIRRVSPTRYDMHGLLRQYAAEKLGAHPQEREHTLLQHVRYFAAFLKRQAESLKGAHQKQALAEIAIETENARQAWQQAVERDDVAQIEQSLESLYQFYDIQSRFREGIELFDQARQRWSASPSRERVVGKVMARQGTLYYRMGLYEQARAALEQSLAIAEQMESGAEQVFCLVHLANVARGQGKHAETEQLAQRSLALSRQTKDVWGVTFSLFLLGAIRYDAGDVDRAEALLQESLAIARTGDDQRLALSPLNTLGDIACYRGDYVRGQVVFQECLALSRELGDPYNTAVHLNNLGTALHSLGKYAEAQALYQESLDICRNIGDLAGQAVALSNLGEIAFALGALRQAQGFYEAGLSIGRTTQNQWAIMICLNNLGEIAIASSDWEGTRVYLAKALKITIETNTLTILMRVVVNLAAFFARQGQPDRAAELLGLARQHPASEQDIQKKAERLLAELGLVPPETIRPLDSVVAEINAEISPSG